MDKGNSYHLLFDISFPLLIGAVLQQLYNRADNIAAGNAIGKTALTAVKPGCSILFMFSFLFMKIGINATIMIFLPYKTKEFNSFKKTVSTIY